MRQGQDAGTFAVEMLVLASTFALLAFTAADPGDTATPIEPTPTTTPAAPPTTTTTTTTTSADAGREARELATLSLFEGELSVGRTLSAKDTTELVTLLDSPSAVVRATTAAVLPWLDPSVSTSPLLAATRDPDVRVRTTATQSLVPLARRLPDADRARVVDAATTLINDPDDEVACAGAELLAAVRTEAAEPAFAAAARALAGGAASDVRYGCLVRFGGLPVRAVTLPPLAERPGDDTPAVVVPGTAPDVVAPVEASTQWLFVADAAAAGLLVGAAIPAGFVPARDVLVYDDTTSRLFRQDVSFATTAGAALLGGAVFGGGAYALDHFVGPLQATEAIAVVGGTGSGVLLGAGLGFMLDPDAGGSALLIAGTTTLGLVGSTALAYTLDLSSNDNAMTASAVAMGGLLGGLGAFAAIPVGLVEVGTVQRTDFGFGTAVATAGLAGLVSLAASPFVEVTPARAAAVSAGGLFGAGVVGGIGFLAVPRDLDTGTRIAAGLGLAGQVVGMAAAGLLIPADWLDVVSPAAVAFDDRGLRLGLPSPVTFAPLPGSSVIPVGVQMIDAHF